MKWSESTLGGLVEQDGGTIQTGPFGSQLHEHEYQSDGVPVIMPKDIYEGRVSTDSVARVSDQTANRLARHKVQPSTIVLPRRGEISKRAFIRADQEGWLCGTGCLKIKLLTKRILLPEFLYYYMDQHSVVRWLEQHAVGTTMLNLSTKIVSDLPVRYPAPTTQQTIADILSAYDDLIENNRRRMALLEQSARLLYEEWFVRLRFPGHEHTKITNGIPEGWRQTPFESALVLQRGFDLPMEDRTQGEVPVCGSTGIDGYHSTAKLSGPGVITGRSGSLGTVYFVGRDYWPLNTSLWVREFKAVTPAFALFLMREMDLKQYNGGASVPTLDRKAVHRLPIIFPPTALMSAFSEFADLTLKQTAKLSDQNAKLRAARDLLLPKLMTGELAV